jgi:hypothetical protein
VITFPQDKLVPRPIDDLLLGERLSLMQGREIGPTELFRLLNSAKLNGVLVGAHAVNARSADPRATLDVDIVAEKPKKVVELFRLAYPHLKVEDHPVVTRFKDEGREAIDVIKPTSSPLFKRILKLTETLDIQGVRVVLADMEAVLALKFQAMVSPARLQEKKLKDGSDFIVLSKHLKKVDRSKLLELGDLAFPGGGDELLKLVETARAGKPIQF